MTMLTYYVIKCEATACTQITDAYPSRADVRALVADAGWTYGMQAGHRCPAHPVTRPVPA